jgi:sterol desaturase/sphingolipid hydroxylase (fatty acid hydroxylase superfamily)
MFLWTALEYGLHRCVFHLDGENTAARRMLTLSHFDHHDDPRDAGKVLVRTEPALILSLVLFLLLYAVSLNLSWTAGLMAGVWSGFLYYEIVHYRVHCTPATSGLIGRQRRAHFHHHFAHNGQCFGVTTPLWDYVFRTGRTNVGR